MKRSNRRSRFLSALLLLALTVSLVPQHHCGTGGIVRNQTASSAAIFRLLQKTYDCQTFRCVPITQEFAAVDPEGDLVTFEAASLPKKGTLTVLDDGGFLYAPTWTAKKARTVSLTWPLTPAATSPMRPP